MAPTPTVTVPPTVAAAPGLVNRRIAVRWCSRYAESRGAGGHGPPGGVRTEAVSTCEPSATLAVFHGIETGPVDAVVMVPTVWPPTLSV